MKNKKRFLPAILLISLILLAGCSSAKTVAENKGILGTWYESVGCEISVMIFYDDGTYIKVFEEYLSDEVHFPSTLNDIGHSILETEEGLDGTLIYVPRDSKIHKYFEENMPYGAATLLVQ